MARKFLYLIAFLIVLAIAALVALRLYPEQLSRLTMVPRTPFTEPAPLAANRYADPAMWFSRPGQNADNPALWAPKGLAEDADASGAAVFFIHPTSHLTNTAWNASLEDNESQDRARLFIRAMASPFNKAPAMWVPRYRQATFGAFLTDQPEGSAALAAAYGDVLAAFDQFVSEIPANQPIILAGHSQGAFHLKHLLADRMAGKPLARRVVAAYAIGWPVSLAHDLPKMGLPACTAPAQTGCLLSWLSVGEPADTAMLVNGYGRRRALDGAMPGGSPFLCTNPLTGVAGGAADKAANLGTLVPSADLKSADLKPGLTGARCRPDGFLSIGEGPDLGPFVLPGNNYHVYDLPLFWANVRADALRRTRAWASNTR